MRILNPESRYGGPGPAPNQYWDGSRPRFGLAHGLFYNLCTTISSCFYVFCCCWMLEDCFMGRRSFPGSRYDSPESSLPPPPPHVGPGPPGFLSSVFGPSGPSHSHYGPGPEPPGMGSLFGPPGPSRRHYGPEPEPPGFLGSVFGPPGPPSSQPGPIGYPGESPPF